MFVCNAVCLLIFSSVAYLFRFLFLRDDYYLIRLQDNRSTATSSACRYTKSRICPSTCIYGSIYSRKATGLLKRELLFCHLGRTPGFFFSRAAVYFGFESFVCNCWSCTGLESFLPLFSQCADKRSIAISIKGIQSRLVLLRAWGFSFHDRRDRV